MKRRSLFGIILSLVAAPWLKAKGTTMPASKPKQYFVLFHSPGPKWDPGKGFRDQPGVSDHIAHMSALLDQGKLVIGGPFLDDSGGMMVTDLPTIEAARVAAESDPAVIGGLLKVEVKPWLVAMSRD